MNYEDDKYTYKDITLEYLSECCVSHLQDIDTKIYYEIEEGTIQMCGKPYKIKIDEDQLITLRKAKGVYTTPIVIIDGTEYAPVYIRHAFDI